MAGMRMAAHLMALREGYSAMAVGVLLSLFALTQVFLALPPGRYADRYGFRRPVSCAVIVACSGAALAVLFPLFPVPGLSLGSVQPMIMSMLHQITPEARHGEALVFWTVDTAVRMGLARLGDCDHRPTSFRWLSLERL
ncbi:MFS transporter [Rhodoferax sp.]|uniref:MFS transporter n=1 Tax=Rhodoferax sp. TaxID=50421 RepID=UPI00283AC2BD|nr:MFS transporter [Rhodoferax sp.]MDR3370218.1 MFS transporter [Rhodoferax sp.]